MNEDCPHCVFEITEDNCRGCFEGSHYKPKQITNAERIRSMTDAELAHNLFLLKSSLVFRHEERILSWLKAEAEEVEFDNVQIRRLSDDKRR